MQLEFTHAPHSYPQELLHLLRQVAYKPNSSLWLLRGAVSEEVLVAPRFQVNDVRTGNAITVMGRPVSCTPLTDERRLVHGLFQSMENLEAHECAEQFTYKGIRVFDPHLSTKAQADLWLQMS